MGLAILLRRLAKGSGREGERRRGGERSAVGVRPRVLRLQQLHARFKSVIEASPLR